MRFRSTPLLVPFLVAALSCNGARSPAGAGAICSAAAAGQSRPLVIEWNALDRTALEARAAGGPILVRRSGCDIEILRGCHAPGAYRYTPVTPKHDRVVIRDSDELWANLPAGAARLQAKLGQTGRLDIAMTVVGQLELDRLSLQASELTGDCAGATHSVASLTTGAFELFAGSTSNVGGGAEFAGIGAGADESHARETLSRDGDPAACDRATAADHSPPERCTALLRIELVPLGDARGSAPACPAGWEWTGAQCRSPNPGAATPVLSRVGGPMVRLAGGNFRLGSNDGGSWSAPQHLITVAPFELDMVEVTAGEFRRCVTAGGCVPPVNDHNCNWGKDGRDEQPMNCIDWTEAVAYCKWAGKRLPTEEEWEFAALGQTGFLYPWGNNAPGSNACWRGPGNDRSVKEDILSCRVDRYPADRSPFGVRDLGGNVSEWTSSARCSYPKAQNRCDETSRIIRGGSFDSQDETALRAYARLTGRGKDEREIWLGFRCAR